MYEAIASVGIDRLVQRIQEGAIDDVNEAVRLLRALTGILTRAALTHDAAEGQTQNRVNAISERIALELYQHVTSHDQWGVPRLEQSPWLLQIDLPRLIDVLAYWSRDRAREVARRLAKPHVIKAILQGQRLHPYSETLLNFGWLARADALCGESLADRSPTTAISNQPRSSERP